VVEALAEALSQAEEMAGQVVPLEDQALEALGGRRGVRRRRERGDRVGLRGIGGGPRPEVLVLLGLGAGGRSSEAGESAFNDNGGSESMSEPLPASEPALRLGVFAAVFALMALWELAAARRQPGPAKPRRWLANLALSVVDSLVVRLVLPTATVGMAILVAERGWGLFHRWPPPPAVAAVASVVLLDLAIYAQHVVFHAVPALWRVHRVHHSDVEVDVSTGIRFHPAEILLSLAFQCAVIAALGPPPGAVFAFAVLLNATAMFSHGNVRLPARMDRWLRRLLVTPDMHRVHHSVDPEESQRNFGFNLSCWDRLFGTYRAEPRHGHRGMILGVAGLEEAEPRGLGALLLLPFARRRRRPDAGADPLSSRR